MIAAAIDFIILKAISFHGRVLGPALKAKNLFGGSYTIL